MAKHVASIAAIIWSPSGLPALLRKREITKRLKEEFLVIAYFIRISF